MSQARILEYANMRQGRPRGDLEQVRRRKRSGTRRKRGTEGERGSTSQERPRQTDQAGVEAHICPAHDRHSQDPPVVERTTHARAIRHAATRHGTRAAFPTGLMSEHPAVFHGLLAAWQLAHAERDERVHAHLVIVADATPQLCHAAELHTSETTANDIWIQARPSSAAFNQHRTAGRSSRRIPAVRLHRAAQLSPETAVAAVIAIQHCTDGRNWRLANARCSEQQSPTSVSKLARSFATLSCRNRKCNQTHR